MVCRAHRHRLYPPQAALAHDLFVLMHERNQQLVESARASGKAELAAAAERLSSYMGAIADSALALKQKGREQVQLVADTTDAYVHDKPWQSVAIGAGIGAAVGFALGCLASRR